MTHEEAVDLLPLLALDALESSEAIAISEHASTCQLCAAQLRELELTASRLGGAVHPQQPPAQLRARVLGSAAAVEGQEAPSMHGQSPAAKVTGIRGRRGAADSSLPATAPRTGSAQNAKHAWAADASRLLWLPRWVNSPRLLAAAVLVLALAGAGAAGWLRDSQARAELRTESAALALLTSTETTADRLEPVAPGLPADAHGHWFHRSGTPTEVVVGEFLPPLSSGEQYVVWQRLSGRWLDAGHLDASGRLVILGSDGAGVSAVEVTRERAYSSQPAGPVMLAFRS